MSKNIYSKKYWKQEAKKLTDASKFTDNSKALQLPWEKKENKNKTKYNFDVNGIWDGYYYLSNGMHIGKLGKSDKTYILKPEHLLDFTLKTEFFNNLYMTNKTLLRIAGLAYGETGYNPRAFKDLAVSVLNHHALFKTSYTERNISIYDKSWKLDYTLVAMRNQWEDSKYFSDNSAFNAFIAGTSNPKPEELITGHKIDWDYNGWGRNIQNNGKMRLAIEAVIIAAKDFGWIEGSNIINQEVYKQKLPIGWHTTDLITPEKPAYKFFYSAGFKFNEGHDIGKFKGKTKKGTNKHGGDYQWESTSSYLGNLGFDPTVFYKPTQGAIDHLQYGTIGGAGINISQVLKTSVDY